MGDDAGQVGFEFPGEGDERFDAAFEGAGAAIRWDVTAARSSHFIQKLRRGSRHRAGSLLMGVRASALRSRRCHRDYSRGFSAVHGKQQDQEEQHAPHDKVRVPPRHKVRDVLNDLVIRVFGHGGAEKKLKYPRHGLGTSLKDMVNIYCSVR